jgi:DNA-binding transcriptional MocR family regulator
LPINGFNIYIVTMTIWQPDLSNRTGPKYRGIAEAIAADIAGGRLAPGDRLPPQRELAWALGVTVGTVSRGYAEAERSGLVKGAVGSGTYVLRPGYRQDNAMQTEPAPGVLDMSIAFPAPGDEGDFFAAALRRLAGDPKYGALLDYQPQGGTMRHRAVGAAWLARTGIEVPPERVVMTAGAQHGITVTLAALTHPGDRVATECLTYNGIKPVAEMLGVKLEGLPIDEHGLRPDGFADACKRGPLRALYCIPTGHNPTTAVMPPARRQAIAEIALRHGVNVIEDDIFASLLPTRHQPLSMMVPGLGFCITSLSKAVAPGLRIGFVAGPSVAIVDRLRQAVRSTCWAATPLTAEIATQWLEDDTAEQIRQSRTQEAVARLGILRDILGNHRFDSVPGHLFVWLHLPDPWRANDFVAEAARRNVRVTSAEVFAVGRTEPPHAVRICFGAPSTREALVTSLKTLAEILSAPAASGPPIV